MKSNRPSSTRPAPIPTRLSDDERALEKLPVGNGGLGGQSKEVWLERLNQVGVSLHVTEDTGAFGYTECESDYHSTFTGALNAALLANPGVVNAIEVAARKIVQIQLTVAGNVAVEALKAAMTTVGIPSENRADLIGFFCNEWNTRTQAIADAKGSTENTGQATA